MTRVVNVDKFYNTTNIKKVLGYFFKKYPELNYWKETFEYMYENNVDFFCDNLFADGTKNPDWRYALHLDIFDDCTYIAVVERA